MLTRLLLSAGLWLLYSSALLAQTTPCAGNGAIWTAQTAAQQNTWNGIAYGNGTFVAVSGDGTNRIMTSPDGISWTARSAAQANTWYSVAYGNGKFVAVSADGDNRVMTAASCTTPGPATCGSPANTIGQPLMITGVTDVSCATGSFRIVTSGGTGQPINFGGIVGLNNADAFNCVRTVDGAGVVRAINNPASDIEPFSLRGMQSGGPASNVFRFDFKQACAGVTARRAVGEEPAELVVTVLGNPTIGESVEVMVENTGSEWVELQVLNAQGQPVSGVRALSSGNAVRKRVVLGGSTGVYLLQVSTPSRSKTVKVVRQ